MKENGIGATLYRFLESEEYVITLEKARDVLRLDGTDNDEIITGLMAAVPDYIELTTGMTPEQQEQEPLVETATGFILKLWYNAEQADEQKLTRTIDCLLKCITLKAKKEDLLKCAAASTEKNESCTGATEESETTGS